MSDTVIWQAIVASIRVTLFLIALLVSAPQALGSRAGVHQAHAGIMFIAPAYQHQNNRAYEV